MRSRVEEFAEIRRAARVEGLSINALAKRFRVHRRTVRQALESAEPPARKTPVRAAPKLDGVRELIDGMLRQDIDAPRKQRQTATRIWHRLLDEHGADVGYPTVRDYVRWRRPEILGTSLKTPSSRILFCSRAQRGWVPKRSSRIASTNNVFFQNVSEKKQLFLKKTAEDVVKDDGILAI